MHTWTEHLQTQKQKALNAACAETYIYEIEKEIYIAAAIEIKI